MKGPSRLGSDLVIEGTVLSSMGKVLIDCMVDGRVDVQGEVEVGKAAKIVGSLSANQIIFNGQIQGDLQTKGELEILESGSIEGNLDVPVGSLIIHEGAVIRGRCMPNDSSKK